jgi:dihydrofolate reductase
LTRPLALVAAIADNGVIGRDNRLIWRLKSDLRRFRDLTWGKPMLMGRKTYVSIGRPLPGRETLVLTRDPAFAAEGVHVAQGWDEAVARAETLVESMGASEIAVVGGAEVYALALPHAHRLYLTQVHVAPEGDTFFPLFDRSAFRTVRSENYPAGPDDEHPFTFVDLERLPESPPR